MVGVDDDDDWQEMPVVASSSARDEAPHGYEGFAEPASGYDSSSSQSSSSSSSSSSTRRKGHKRKSSQRAAFAPSSHRASVGVAPTTNATGKSLNVDDARGYDWRSKPAAAKNAEGKGGGGDDDDDSDAEDDDEQGKGYTQLRLDEDVEEDELHAATEYLFGGGAGAAGGGPNPKDPHESAVGYSYQNESNATPLSQMMTTKALLSEAQKIAYVGLCSLEAKEIVRLLKRIPGSNKDLSEAIKSAEEWHLRVEARLFQHMDIDASEQKMIQSLAEHGVLATDLAPSLVTTQKIDNPDYDPQAADEEAERVAQVQAAEAVTEDVAHDEEPSAAPAEEAKDEGEGQRESGAQLRQGDEDDDGDLGGSLHSPAEAPVSAPASQRQVDTDEEGDLGAAAEDGGDLGAQEEGATTPTPRSPKADSPSLPAAGPARADPNTAAQLAAEEANVTAKAEESKAETHLGLTSQPQTVEPPPNALPGVTTQISTLDTHITLDLRWTVLCDLFLVLTADSVYDSRSRVLLERVAEQLGLTWMDVTKFEKRVTDALEIEEGVEKLKDKKAIARREREARNKKWAMVGLATVGGGLVIGLSAGLAAPLVGSGLAALLGGVGIGGTSTFLGSIGGAALITTTGASAGAALGGRGMARRTQSVKTFMFKPIHNNKRINCIVTMPGFMAGPQDDVRLPFSVIDSIMGDVFSVLWEPEMMQEMGNAMHILWNETLVMGVQQVLMTTIAGGLLGALAWPLWLTKLGYLIDNPWSNACTRAQAAGKILADVLAKRQLGVRPITLVGFSLGARAIFYALCELAKKKAFGVVQNVYIFGTPVTASDKVWKEARSVVAGRFVNGFSRTDWILGYLFRATSGGLRSIAGLHPVERVPDVENVDVTTSVPGHLQYRAFMPLVLSEVGFRVTQDWFDEPEDLSKIPDRQVVLEEEAAAAKHDPVKAQNAGGLPQAPPRSSSKEEYEYDEGEDDDVSTKKKDDDDDDDLPPREEHASKDSTAESRRADAEHAAATHIDGDAMLAELRESGIEVKELQSSLPALTIAQPASPAPAPAVASPTALSAPAPAPASAPAPSKPTSGFKASVASFFGSRKTASSSSSASSSRPTTPTLPSAPSDAVTANRGAASQKRPLYLSRDSSMTAASAPTATATPPLTSAAAGTPPLSRRSSATPSLRGEGGSGGSSGRQSPMPAARAPFSYAQPSTAAAPSTPAGLPAESTVNLSFASDFDDADEDEEPKAAGVKDEPTAQRNDYASSATSYGLSAEAAKDLARQFGGGSSTSGEAATESRKGSIGGGSGADWSGSGWGDSSAALPSPSAFSSSNGLNPLRPLETSYGALVRERSASVSVGGGLDEADAAYQGAAVRERAPSSARAGANSGLGLDENPWG